MTEAFENHQLAARDIAMKTLCVFRWYQMVAAAPNNERRQFKRGDAAGVGAEISLLEALDQRGSIPRPQRQVKIAIDERRCHFSLVAVDVAQTRLDKAEIGR